MRCYVAGQTSLLFAKKRRCCLQDLLSTIMPCSPKGPSPESNSTFSSATAKLQRKQWNNCVNTFIGLGIITCCRNYAGPWHLCFKENKHATNNRVCSTAPLHGINPNPSVQQQNYRSPRYSPRTKHSNKLTVRAKTWLLKNHRHYKLYPLNESNIRLCWHQICLVPSSSWATEMLGNWHCFYTAGK